MTGRTIHIRNARSNNLQGVHCDIPIGALTVVTGPSGSGKSTLAFETLYAEGQRRYVSSLSAYARQFLERLPRPEVDSISNLPPAIAIEQRNGVTGARSTVGSATEVLDHLRLLFARVGQTFCPDCDRPVEAGGVIATADRIAAEHSGERILVVAPIRSGEGRAGAVRDALVRDGQARLIDEGGEIIDLLETHPRRKPSAREPWWLLIDRLALRGEEGERTRLVEAVAEAFERGAGELEVRRAGEGGRRTTHREGRVCDGCARSFPEPSPGLFSFNNPIGACGRCEGFGRIAEIDWGKVVPDPSKSLREDAVAVFASPTQRHLRGRLLNACDLVGIDVDRPFLELSRDQQSWVFEGDGESWRGVRAFFDWLGRRRYRVQARVLIARHRRFDPCPECGGSRLSTDARAVRVAGRTIAELARCTLEDLLIWVEGLRRETVGGARAERLLDLIETRLKTIHAVGLGYLQLDRAVRTLSGGEAQRIQLATALGGSLTGSLYVLDEPSIGLHAADLERLLRVLEAIRRQGNTVVVVEHALPLIAAADHLIDLGPGAGRRGGRIVAAGSVEEVRSHADSKTGAALRGELDLPDRPRRDLREAPRLVVRDAWVNNLEGFAVELPLGGLVAITGVSGAGKSTLLHQVLVPGLDSRPRIDSESAVPARIEGTEWVHQVVVVDQSPAARSLRSNPATVTKAFDAIRQRFAATREAKARGYTPGTFSFNVAGGRCDTCEGAGEVVIDMQFLDDLRVLCDDCGGRRYRREVLDIRIEGRSILDVLRLSLEEASEVFAGEKRVVERLEPLVRVGLGYLELGQSLSTLSGGELQRLRLGQALVEGRSGALYVFDEPTTGLHPSDVAVLLRCLEEVVESGASVFVVEHDLDVIRAADWVVDLGPGGGPHGGRLMAEGPPEVIAGVAQSLTGRLLAEYAGGEGRESNPPGTRRRAPHSI